MTTASFVQTERDNRGGHNQLEETISVIGVPVLTTASFVQTERDIGELWKRNSRNPWLKLSNKKSSWLK